MGKARHTKRRLRRDRRDRRRRCVLSLIALFCVWLPHCDLPAAVHEPTASTLARARTRRGREHGARPAPKHAARRRACHDKHRRQPVTPITGDWYTLGHFGTLQLTIGYYIDSLTVVDVLHGDAHRHVHPLLRHRLHARRAARRRPITKSRLPNGHHLHRRGRFHRFFQYLSLFCFSMLGIVHRRQHRDGVRVLGAGRHLLLLPDRLLHRAATARRTAANKAFIVNRVGDFGMIIGLMALWSTPGHVRLRRHDNDGDGNVEQPGIFSQVHDARKRTISSRRADGMIAFEAARRNRRDRPQRRRCRPPMQVEDRRAAIRAPAASAAGYWLLFVAGLGIFCGCVGKSAQFPLHVWLPDAMEGPTPVSRARALGDDGRRRRVPGRPLLSGLHARGAAGDRRSSAASRCSSRPRSPSRPTDIKRVLAYSTVSQLGYMMLALGVGGWVAGLFHLITHAFFKSLLFMCSGSVIHAVPHQRHDARWAACGRRCRSPPTRCSSAAWRSSAPAFRFRSGWLQRLLLEGRDPRPGADRSRQQQSALRHGCSSWLPAARRSPRSTCSACGS